MKAEQRFKQIELNEVPPAHIKKQLMTNIKLANLFMEVADLFSVKMAKVIGGLFNQEGINPVEPPDHVN